MRRLIFTPTPPAPAEVFHRETRRAIAGEVSGPAFAARRLSRFGTRAAGLEEGRCASRGFVEGNRAASDFRATARSGQAGALSAHGRRERMVASHRRRKPRRSIASIRGRTERVAFIPTPYPDARSALEFFAHRSRNAAEFLSAHANGIFLRAIIAPRFWRRGESARRRAKSSRFTMSTAERKPRLLAAIGFRCRESCGC